MANRVAEVVSIKWWNRPITWGIGLVILAVMGLGMLGQSVSGPGDSHAAPVVSAPADAPADAPVSTPAPAPKLDPASVRSGDNGISIHGNHNTVTIPQATPRTTVNEVTIIQPEREKLVIVEQQVPIIVERERRVEVPVIVERERRVPVYVSRSDCGERRAEYEFKVAEIKRRIFQMD